VERALPTGTVTLLFTDMEGSTRLLAAIGEQYGTLLAEHHRLLREVWAQHGGTEVDAEGDAFFVAFAEAGPAVAAAIEAQRRIAAHEWPGGRTVRVRMGLHTGTPRVRDGGYWGADVHYAARLVAAAHGGQILASAATRALLDPSVAVESLGEHGLKDFPAPREIFHVGGGASAFPPPRTLERAHTNMPLPAQSLVGRDQELDALERSVAEQRLVSLVGPGGSGKTRLAIELGRRIGDRFDGAWFVRLAEVAEPADVPAAVARAAGLPEVAGVPPLDRVLDHARDRRLLLVIDNAEHVLDAAPGFARIAAAGDGVRVVVTSQAPLRVAGEHVLRVEPLRLPEAVNGDLEALAEVPSVALLLQRARAAGSELQLDAGNAADVAELCRRLEGMPLAIELAAARLGVLDPAGLLRRLDQGIDSLGTGRRDLPERQRGLRAVLEWTSGLLESDERELLAKLTAFAGDFNPDVVEAAFGDAVDGLVTLVDVGLVRRVGSGRLALRPPVRAFAAELLDTGEAHRAVARALAELGERFEARWTLVTGEGRLALNPEAANILAALDWTRDHDPALHARLAAATGWWTTHSNLVGVARGHLELALGRTEDPRMRARLLQALGALGLADADAEYSTRAADAWRDLGDGEREVICLFYAANLHGHGGDGDSAMALVERAAAVIAALPFDEGLEWLLEAARADALSLLGRHDEADAIMRPLLARAEPRSWLQFWAATKSADIALVDNRSAEALELYGVAMEVLRPFGSPLGELLQADTIALALAQLDRLDDAAMVVAICDVCHRELSWTPRGALADAVQTAREAAGPERMAAARRRAAALGMHGGLDRVRAIASGEDG
jgi:predicted ATPase/class 3 adenylate cyclase